MPTAITPVVQFTTTDPTRPIPGEKIGMETGPAPLAPLLQTLVDRDNFAWALVSTLMPYCGEVEITSANLVVPPLSVSLLSGAVWKVFSTVGAAIPLTPLAAVADAWRYAYLFDNSGTLDVQFSADPPDATRTWKSTGISTHRYLCAIRMSAVAGAAVPMVGRNGRWVYRDPQEIEAAAVNTGGWGALSLATRVPPHVRRADVGLQVSLADGLAYATGRLRSVGSTVPTHNLSIAYENAWIADVVASMSAEVMLDATQNIEREATFSGGVTKFVRTNVRGFVE